jgi:hypothetical protein
MEGLDMSEKPLLNPKAFAIAEETAMRVLNESLKETHNEGFVGTPRLLEGTLDGYDQWWFLLTGNDMRNQPLFATQTAFTGEAYAEGIFEDRQRAWEFIIRVHQALPIKRERSIHELSTGGSSPTNQLEFFELHGREGKFGLYHVVVPLFIVVDYTFFDPEPEET